jgi:hypothetical protein
MVARFLSRHGGRAALLAAAIALFPAADALAKLEDKEWKAAEEEWQRLFTQPGFPEDKAKLARLLEGDGQTRAWRLLTEALVLECQHWIQAEKALSKLVGEIAVNLAKPSKDRYPADEAKLTADQEALPGYEDIARRERGILDDLTSVIAKGPQALRLNILARAKGPVDWPFRAAAGWVAAADPLDKESAGFLVRVFGQDKDPRVRLASLEALRSAKEGWEDHVIGRVGDGDWTVQLLAVQLVAERKTPKGVPHLINALDKASPRVQEAIGKALRELTGQNFEPYADVWAKWWADHKDEYQSNEAVKAGKPREPLPDVKFYGLPLKSDRILFIIDISGSMKELTKNDGPTPSDPKKPPVTPKEGEKPPPPPPEEVLSGPKIDVAKHELKKAIQKLPKEARFNIIAFNHTVLQWKKEMLQATDETKEEAYKWIRQWNPSGSTYIDGALRTGFQLAGLGAVDKAYPEVVVDTMVLLSDGAPTTNSLSKPENQDPNEILAHVREWNKYRRVVIHTIGVDIVESIEFMKKLAEENGGTYVDR